MKSKYLFLSSGLLLIAGIIFIAQSFHGTLGLTGAAPVAGSALEISGSAHGGWALAGMIAVVLSAVAFLVAAVRAFAFETEK